MLPFLEVFVEILQWIAVASEALLFAVILTHTPHNMKKIRIYFLTISIANIAINLSNAILVLPQGVPSLPGITINGLLKYTGDWGGIMSAACGCSFFSAPTISILLCSLVRLQGVAVIDVDKYRPLFTTVLFCGILAPFLAIPMFYSDFFLDRQARTFISADLLADTRPYMVFDLSSRLIIPAGAIFMIVCGCGASVTVFINITHIRSLQLMNRSAISAARHDLQKRIMITLLAPVGLTILGGFIFFIFCIPLIYDYFTYNTFDVSYVIPVFFALFPPYSLGSAVITFGTITPYRNFWIQVYRKTAGRKNLVAVRRYSSRSSK